MASSHKVLSRLAETPETKIAEEKGMPVAGVITLVHHKGTRGLTYFGHAAIIVKYKDQQVYVGFGQKNTFENCLGMDRDIYQGNRKEAKISYVEFPILFENEAIANAMTTNKSALGIGASKDHTWNNFNYSVLKNNCAHYALAKLTETLALTDDERKEANQLGKKIGFTPAKILKYARKIHPIIKKRVLPLQHKVLLAEGKQLCEKKTGSISSISTILKTLMQIKIEVGIPDSQPDDKNKILALFKHLHKGDFEKFVLLYQKELVEATKNSDLATFLQECAPLVTYIANESDCKHLLTSDYLAAISSPAESKSRSDPLAVEAYIARLKMSLDQDTIKSLIETDKPLVVIDRLKKEKETLDSLMSDKSPKILALQPQADEVMKKLNEKIEFLNKVVERQREIKASTGLFSARKPGEKGHFRIEPAKSTEPDAPRTPKMSR